MYVSLGSSVTHKIVGCGFMVSAVLSICSVLYFAGSGVNNVQVVLSVLTMRLLSFVHVCNCCALIVELILRHVVCDVWKKVLLKNFGND